MDARAALSLMIEWGADEALDDAPVDRTRPAPVPKPEATPLAAPALAAIATRETPAARATALASAAPTLSALRAAVAGFTECPLAATATTLVFADGNPEARIVLVGETPGPEEDMSGRPLDGPAGALLDRMLGSIGLDRGQVLVTSLIPWRPPGNRQPSQAEIAMCLPFLVRHLELVGPRIVVTLGALPAQMLTGSTATMRKLRGNWQSIQLSGVGHEVKLLPMAHPASLIRAPAAKRDAWQDLLALQRVLNSD